MRRMIFSPVNTSISTCTGCRIQAFRLQNLEQEVRPPHRCLFGQHIGLHLHVQRLVAVRSSPPARSWHGAWVSEGFAFLKPTAAARQELGTVDAASAAAEIWVQVTLSLEAGASSAASQSAGKKLRAETASESKTLIPEPHLRDAGAKGHVVQLLAAGAGAPDLGAVPPPHRAQTHLRR